MHSANNTFLCGRSSECVPLLAPTHSVPDLFLPLFLQIELEAILGLNQDLLPPLDENGQIIPNKLSKVRAKKNSGTFIFHKELGEIVLEHNKLNETAT